MLLPGQKLPVLVLVLQLGHEDGDLALALAQAFLSFGELSLAAGHFSLGLLQSGPEHRVLRREVLDGLGAVQALLKFGAQFRLGPLELVGQSFDLVLGLPLSGLFLVQQLGVLDEGRAFVELEFVALSSELGRFLLGLKTFALVVVHFATQQSDLLAIRRVLHLPMKRLQLGHQVARLHLVLLLQVLD